MAQHALFGALQSDLKLKSSGWRINALANSIQLPAANKQVAAGTNHLGGHLNLSLQSSQSVKPWPIAAAIWRVSPRALK